MNIYLVFIISSIVLSATLGIFLEFLNMKSLTPEVPLEMRDIFDSETYQKTQTYARAQAKEDLIQQTITTFLLVAFILFGGFAQIDAYSTQLTSAPIPQGLFFIGMLFALSEIVSFPFSLYRTFVLESRFGFNKTTWRTYLTDKFKSYILAVALGAPLLSTILWLFERMGSLAWAWCWLAMTIFSLGITYLAPTFIFPLFNKFTPLQQGELRSRLESLADQTGFRLTDIFVMDGSRRSTKSNAFFTGLGKRKRIALFDTLVASHSHEEIAAILAHEIGHYRCGHITSGFLLSTLHTGILLFLMSFFLDTPALFHAFGLQTMPVHAGLVFFTLLFTPLSLLLTPLFAFFSRKHEFEADRFAAKAMHTALPLVQALKKLSADNLSNLTPHPWYVIFHYSHPPVLERLRVLQQKQR